MSNTIGWGKGSLNNSIGWGQGGFEYAETIVNISSAQILAMGTTPIELLPAPGVGKYYDIDKITFEYTHNTTAYTYSSYLYVYGQTEYGVVTSLITDPNDKVWILRPNGTTPPVDGVENYSFGYGEQLNNSVTIGTWDASNPTLGDGTLRVKVYYKTITFGS